MSHCKLQTDQKSVLVSATPAYFLRDFSAGLALTIFSCSLTELSNYNENIFFLTYFLSPLPVYHPSLPTELANLHAAYSLPRLKDLKSNFSRASHALLSATPQIQDKIGALPYHVGYTHSPGKREEGQRPSSRPGKPPCAIQTPFEGVLPQVTEAQSCSREKPSLPSC